MALFSEADEKAWKDRYEAYAAKGKGNLPPVDTLSNRQTDDKPIQSTIKNQKRNYSNVYKTFLTFTKKSLRTQCQLSNWCGPSIALIDVSKRFCVIKHYCVWLVYCFINQIVVTVNTINLIAFWFIFCFQLIMVNLLSFTGFN